MCNHFGDIQRQRMAWPWNQGLGSFKVVENGAVRQIMYDFLLVRHCNYSSMLYRLRVIWRRLISWPWNLVTQGHWNWCHSKAWVLFAFYQGRIQEFTKGEAVTAVDESPPQAENFFSPPDYCMRVLLHFWWTEMYGAPARHEKSYLLQFVQTNCNLFEQIVICLNKL